MAKVIRKAKSKSFKDWLYEEVCDAFGLTEVMSHPEIEKLKTIKLPIDDLRRNSIEELRVLLKQYINSWNEDAPARVMGKGSFRESSGSHLPAYIPLQIGLSPTGCNSIARLIAGDRRAHV